MHFQNKNYVVSFLLPAIEGFLMSMCIVTGDNHLDYLAQVVSAGVLAVKL